MRSIHIFFAASISCIVLLTGCVTGHSETIITSDTIPTRADSFHYATDRNDSLAAIIFPEVAIHFTAHPGFKFIMRVSKGTGDTLEIPVEPGEAFQSKKISIVSDVLTHMEVAQRYRTSVFISNKGLPIELKDWKHYNSDWIAIKPGPDGSFTYRSYTREEKNRFLTLASVDEIRKFLLTQSGHGGLIAHLISQTPSIHNDPLSVGIGLELLRITGIRKSDGVKISKTVILYYDQNLIFR